MSLSVIIVDDEPLARARLARLLAGAPDVTIVAECADGESAVAAIAAHDPDLVLLDVQMPETDTFAFVEMLAPHLQRRIAFVTAFAEHAVRAFSAHALDYLVKPVDAARLGVTLDRARTHKAGGVAGAYVERLTVRMNGRTVFVPASDVDYVASAANYVDVHASGQVYRMRETLADVERMLDPRKFARIHRTTVVNLDRVAEVQPWFSGDAVVVMRNGDKLRLSRTHREALAL